MLLLFWSVFCLAGVDDDDPVNPFALAWSFVGFGGFGWEVVDGLVLRYVGGVFGRHVKGFEIVIGGFEKQIVRDFMVYVVGQCVE